MIRHSFRWLTVFILAFAVSWVFLGGIDYIGFAKEKPKDKKEKKTPDKEKAKGKEKKSKGDDGGDKSDDKKTADKSDESRKKKGPADAGKDIYSTISLVPFEYSKSNNPKTDFTVNRGKAKAIAEKLEGQGGQDRSGLVALLSARRLEGAGIATAISIAKKFLAVEMQASIENDLPDFVKLELVLTAIQAKKYSFAEYFLFDLKQSENMLVRASAYNAEGIIFAADKKLPEAEISWRESIKAVPNFKAARLNLGFYGLKFGDFKLAKSLLGPFQNDLFAAAGLVTAERMDGKHEKATSLCDKVLKAEPKFKEMIYNCGLNEFQGNNDFDKALSMFKRVTKIPTLSTDIDELAYAQMSKVDEARLKSKASAKAKAQD